MQLPMNSMERKIVDLSSRRYNRWSFRWGHLLGWLALPLFLVAALPGSEKYSGWLLTLSAYLMFHWYFVVTTRVIGKLKAALDARNEQAPSR